MLSSLLIFYVISLLSGVLSDISFAGSSDSTLIFIYAYLAVYCFFFLIALMVTLVQAARISSTSSKVVSQLLGNLTRRPELQHALKQHAWLLQLVLSTRENDIFTIVGVSVTMRLVVRIGYVIFSVIVFVFTRRS